MRSFRISRSGGHWPPSAGVVPARERSSHSDCSRSSSVSRCSRALWTKSLSAESLRSSNFAEAVCSQHAGSGCDRETACIFSTISTSGPSLPLKSSSTSCRKPFASGESAPYSSSKRASSTSCWSSDASSASSTSACGSICATGNHRRINSRQKLWMVLIVAAGRRASCSSMCDRFGWCGSSARFRSASPIRSRISDAAASVNVTTSSSAAVHGRPSVDSQMSVAHRSASTLVLPDPAAADTSRLRSTVRTARIWSGVKASRLMACPSSTTRGLSPPGRPPGRCPRPGASSTAGPPGPGRRCRSAR